ncbi:MAG TPA: response regulator [Polyangiaceae bacterium]|nr:response regulator [Polyangiaceae bacterium]
MLAEDDDDFRTLLATRLSAEGYTVVEAEDGDELLDLLVDASTMDADRRLTYDAIITDVLMPGFSGLDVLQAFRRSTASAAVIVMSAFDDTRFVHNARALGAVAFLRKPFDNAKLVRILGEALKPVR